MKSRLLVGLVVIWGASASSLVPPRDHITVIVRDFAGVPGTTMRSAETQAEQIFGTAGVTVTWVQQLDAILLPTASLPAELVVDIIPSGATRRNADPGALGYAVPPESGGFASYAGILYERVEQLTAAGMPPSVVLGYAFAHELGHLLLGPGRHALSGIMKAKWDHADFELAAEGRFGFHAAERRRLRNNFLLRVQSTRP